MVLQRGHLSLRRGLSAPSTGGGFCILARPHYISGMCGRFSQHYTWREIHAMSSLSVGQSNLQPRYNIAPTTTVDVIRHNADGVPEMVKMRWWLVPSWWSKGLKQVPATFNARIETVETARMFRDAYKKRRCIIPASGFFEWTVRDKKKQPHYFTSPEGKVLAFAGLWDSWTNRETGEVIESCTIITGPPNEWMLQFHDRAPTMLEEAYFNDWMTCKVGIEVLTIAPIDSLRQWEFPRG
jgi:putative SOS response-associated peptidase YedK